jgi:hypothetical protein
MGAQHAVNAIDDGAPTDHLSSQIDPVPRVSIQAFCDSPDIAAIVSAATSDRRMAKTHFKQNMGGTPAAVEAFKNAPTPNVVVLEAPSSRTVLLAQLEELAQYCDAGTKVVVLGKMNDIVLYRQLIARGVNEYLVMPFSAVDFVRIVESLSLGLTLPEAVERMAQRVPIAEANFFSIVIAIQGKAGGNLSEAIGNLSRVLRERKKMKGKISAMSMEAKASAAIIGAVPFLVVGALYVSSPKYVSLLWTTSHGRMISVIAICWMAIGVAMMKKMISFDF